MGRSNKKREVTRKALTKRQREILTLLLRFRFASVELLAIALGKARTTSMYERLRLLQQQGYIDRRFDERRTLRDKPAAYFLKPKALTIMRDAGHGHGLASTSFVRKATYRHPKVSFQFVDKNLQVLRIYCQLKLKYGDNLQFFTSFDLIKFDYFLQPLPAAYMALKQADGQQTERFFVELVDSSKPWFLVRNRLRQYVDYFEGGIWEETDTDFPTVLFICPTKTAELRLSRLLHSEDLAMDIDEMSFAIAHVASMTDLNQQGDELSWRIVDKINE